MYTPCFGNVVNLVVLSTCLFVRQVAATKESSSFAVVRPFSLADAKLLPRSFDSWREFPPCSHGSRVKFDLFLVFSRSLDFAPEAQSSIRAVKSMVAQKEEWSSCISEVYGIGVDIDPMEDTYNLTLQKTSQLWVNGPNRQFERTYRAVQMFGYDLMYFMEIDSVPIQSYWIDSLIDMIETDDISFAILGRSVTQNCISRF